MRSKAGIVNSNLCVSVSSDNKWGYYKVPFILGGTSNGIEIDSNGVAVTGDVYLDEAFVGVQELTQQINACDSADCTTVFSAKIDSAGVVYNENVNWINGNCSYTSGVATCTLNSGLFTTAPSCTTTSLSNRWMKVTPGSSSIVTTAYIDTATVSANVTFDLICQRQGSDYTSALYRANGNTYSSNNADTDWRSCGHTTSSFTGFGTVTGIETQCKRQGSDLLMKGKFTTGTVTATEARLSLPVWNGIQLVSKNSTIIPSFQYTGDLVHAFNSTTFFRNSVLIEPSVSYMTFGIQSSTANAITKATGSAGFSNTSASSFSARIPIEGWENSNVIIGQFNGLESCASTLDCTDTFSAYIDSTGAVISENVDFINGSCTASSGDYSCTFNSGIFTVNPSCVVQQEASNVQLRGINLASLTTTTLSYNTWTTTATKGALRAWVVCQKQGVDYVGKTARAVASDQNLRTPGVTKSVVYSASISSTGNINSEFGDFINGNCVVTSTNVFTCSFNSGVFASDPVCQVSVIGVSGSSRSIYIAGVPSSTSVTYLTYNTSGPTAVALNAQLTCHGISP